MSKPGVPKLPVPMLTEVVQVNGSLRPAVLPWATPKPTTPVTTTETLAPDPEALADQVIARVQMHLDQILPELMRNAVDEVLSEYVDNEHKLGNRPKA
ncbi:MAG: hypothetical protein EBZ60_05955 [Betaproteobacteria bacterium]|nr:hypothetical protein [Betaproteobacteria bacterium]